MFRKNLKYANMAVPMTCCWYEVTFLLTLFLVKFVQSIGLLFLCDKEISSSSIVYVSQRASPCFASDKHPLPLKSVEN